MKIKIVINTWVMFVCIYTLCFFACPCNAHDFAIGADLSFMKQAHDNGFVFKEDGKAKPCLQIFSDHGYNWIRLRLFHTPTKLPNDLKYTIALAKEAKKMGFKFLLDYHYSDTWADPGKQHIPKAWQGKSHDELVKAVYDYTMSTITEFRKSGVLPDMVQIGNEVCHGILWPDGKLPANWDNFAELVKAGITGIRTGSGKEPCPKIMIHIAKGGDKKFTEYFFDKLNSYAVKYDVIGQSYYPWWHGSLLDLRECLNFTAKKYNKDIFVVEAAYNYKPKEYINKNAPFPESPEGQKEFLEQVHQIILNVADGRGRGIFWWEPAAPGKEFSTRTFFDKHGNVLPVINVFDKYTRK